MRKRNTPIRMISVHPAPRRPRRTVLALFRRFVPGMRPAQERGERRLEGLDLDQRVREVGEW